jgi:hypothetical protein
VIAVRHRGLALVVLVFLACGMAAPSALGDGDPASDVLLAQNVFYPYSPAVTQPLQKVLNRETSAAAKAHFHLKVALIDSQFDLGVVPEMFRHPQTYAKFLDQELHLFLGPHPPLLVVMPNGYGTEGLPTAAQRAVAALPQPSGTTSNALAQAAEGAVTKLAAAAGHPIASAGGGGSGDSGGGSSVWTVVIVALAAVALAAAVLLARRRLASNQ